MFSDLQCAANVCAGNPIGSRSGQVFCLHLAELIGFFWANKVVNSSTSAADSSLYWLPEYDIGNMFEQLPRCRFDLLSMQHVTSIVVGDGYVFSVRMKRFELSDKFLAQSLLIKELMHIEDPSRKDLSAFLFVQD